MREFEKAVKACVASWSLLKDEARKKGMNAYNLIRSGGWSPDPGALAKLSQGVSPREFQRKLYCALRKKADKGGLIVLEAPTAAGKTEAAVGAFLSQLIEGEWWLAPRLVYALPTKALTLTMYARLEAYSAGLSVLYQVSRLPTAFEYGSTLDVRRSYLYGGVMVAATLDAVMYGYGALRIPGGVNNPRLSMPAALLSTSLLVLDEIQLYQDPHYYSPRVIGWVVETLVKAGVPVVYMSATVPSKFLEFIAPGEYEVITAESTEFSRKRFIEVNIDYLKKQVKLPDALHDGHVMNLLKECLDGGRHVLVVVNTVARAVECYELLKKKLGKDKVVLIHGRMSNALREEKEGELFAGSYVVVATQVIEAGFDLEAGLLISEIAPLDSLIQRAGRIARGGGEGSVVIVDVEHPAPYVKELIEATKSTIINDPSILEKALRDVKKAREELDKVYTHSLINELMKKASPLMARTMSYLRRLRLFSLPPEEDFALREGFYVTLVAPEAMEALASTDVEQLVKEFIEIAEKGGGRGAKEKKELWLKAEDWEKLAPVIERSSFTLGFPASKREEGQNKSRRKSRKKSRRSGVEILQPAEKLRELLAASLAVSHIRKKDKEKKKFVQIIFNEVKRVKPLRIYLLKRGVYDLEIGLHLRGRDYETVLEG